MTKTNFLFFTFILAFAFLAPSITAISLADETTIKSIPLNSTVYINTPVNISTVIVNSTAISLETAECTDLNPGYIFNVLVTSHNNYSVISQYCTTGNITELSQTYNKNTYVTAVETFSATVSSLVSSISYAKLNYNGTIYNGIVTSLGSNRYSVTASIPIPNSVGTNTFYWTVYALDGTSLVLTSHTQNVNTIEITECTTPTTDGLTLNFTITDTSTELPINGTFESTFSYYSTGSGGSVLETFSFTNTNENRSNYMFCLNSSGYNISLNSFISYGKTGYTTRDYIIQNATIGNFTQNIPLYLTLMNLSNIVTVTVQDQGYNPLPGALVSIQKWVVGTNTFPTIGMFTTSTNGQGIIDLELYNTWYRASVVYNGQLVKVTDIQKLSSTSWAITVQLGVDNPYDLFGTVSHSLVFDNVTNITTFTWSDNSGYVQDGCLVIQNLTSTGEVEIFNTCVTSVAGTINYQLTSNSSYQIYSIIYLNGQADNASQIQDTLFVDLGGPSQLARLSHSHAAVITIIALGTAMGIGVAAGSPILGCLVAITMLFGAWKIGWIYLTPAIFWSILIVVIVVLFRQNRRGG